MRTTEILISVICIGCVQEELDRLKLQVQDLHTDRELAAQHWQEHMSEVLSASMVSGGLDMPSTMSLEAVGAYEDGRRGRASAQGGSSSLEQKSSLHDFSGDGHGDDVEGGLDGDLENSRAAPKEPASVTWATGQEHSQGFTSDRLGGGYVEPPSTSASVSASGVRLGSDESVWDDSVTEGDASDRHNRTGGGHGGGHGDGVGMDGTARGGFRRSSDAASDGASVASGGNRSDISSMSRNNRSRQMSGSMSASIGGFGPDDNKIDLNRPFFSSRTPLQLPTTGSLTGSTTGPPSVAGGGGGGGSRPYAPPQGYKHVQAIGANPRRGRPPIQNILSTPPSITATFHPKSMDFMGPTATPSRETILLPGDSIPPSDHPMGSKGVVRTPDKSVYRYSLVRSSAR